LEFVYIPHSALTHKSQILKEATLRDHAGWSTNSKMPSVYLHYFGTESCNSILETSGIIKKEGNQALGLMSIRCPGCKELNKPGSRFCTKCEMVLTYDAYAETLAKEQHRDSEINHLRVKLEAVQEEQNQRFDQVIEMIRYNPKLARLKREVLMTRPLKKK
jgi:phage FluMu protein Com